MVYTAKCGSYMSVRQLTAYKDILLRNICKARDIICTSKYNQ